eukprot:GFUD01116563.1.p1 GENE.GFUD01116563.1~~GFUD01116563.1.p1  ORF type:complete len:188 (+),score=40.58 GFUD01116563.1:29-565(+)
MQKVQKYLLESVKTGGLDEKTISEVLEALQTVLDSVYELERFSAVVDQMLADRFGDEVSTRVTVLRRNIFIFLRGVRTSRGRQESPRTAIMIKAKYQGVRSLQDLAAHQVACSIRNSPVSLEQLPIPSLTKKVVGKFVVTANMITQHVTYENQKYEDKKILIFYLYTVCVDESYFSEW